MIGKFENFKLTYGSFGEQLTTIDGVRYLTWFDLRDPNLKGLDPGAEVEYEVRPGPTALCHMPHVTSELGSAKLIRVLRPSAEGA